MKAQEVWEISSDAPQYMHQASDDANQGFSLGSKLFSSDLLWLLPEKHTEQALHLSEGKWHFKTQYS